ncbi:MAG: di-trans,poly-cis-decaprenylcistransferase, partial [Proteobacteria bacterium]
MPKFSLFGAPQGKNGSGSKHQHDFDPGKLPRHIAIIMDGNGRWARRNLLPRVEGHRAGAKTVRMVVEECRRLGIKYLTLFSFSTENWNRPKDEVGALMKLFEQYLRSELKLLLENDIRLRAIGDLSKLPQGTSNCLQEVMEQTQGCNSMQLVLALSYGGREEIISAAKYLAQKARSGELDPDQIREEHIKGALYAPDL